MGHGLAVLYTALDDDIIAKVFNFMTRNGYDLEKNFLSICL